MKLEAVIKEDRAKYNQSHQRSFEVIEKYSNELKLFKAQQSSSNDSNKIKPLDLIERQTQTVDLSNIEMFNKFTLVEAATQTDENEHVTLTEKIKKLHSIFNKSSGVNESQNLKLLDEIEEHINKLNKKLDDVDEERRKINQSLESMKNEHKQMKESKTKLEALYKIKCKSDLDKSSIIKKLKIDYEIELMKFRNEENSDIVHHLEKQLSLKELQIMEQSYELESWRSHETTLNSVGLHGIGTNSIGSSFHQELTSSHNTFFNSKLTKKVPVDILYTSDPDVVTSTV